MPGFRKVIDLSGNKTERDEWMWMGMSSRNVIKRELPELIPIPWDNRINISDTGIICIDCKTEEANFYLRSNNKVRVPTKLIGQFDTKEEIVAVIKMLAATME